MILDVIAFFAHPDDETMLCGGTLALLAKQGARIHVLMATRGEGGDLGVPPLATREQLGKVRENELRCAIEALGAVSLSFMNYIDPTVGPNDSLFAFTEDVDELVAQLTEAVHFWKAGAILSHGVNGEYGHPAHKLAHQAAHLAVQAIGEQAPLFYSVAAAFPENPRPRLENADGPADIMVNVKPFMAQKTAAAMCHKTQHDLFTRHTAEEVGHAVTVPEVILPVESLHRVWPGAETAGKIHDALADLLWASGCAYLPADRPLE